MLFLHTFPCFWLASSSMHHLAFWSILQRMVDSLIRIKIHCTVLQELRQRRVTNRVHSLREKKLVVLNCLKPSKCSLSSPQPWKTFLSHGDMQCAVPVIISSTDLCPGGRAAHEGRYERENRVIASLWTFSPSAWGRGATVDSVSRVSKKANSHLDSGPYRLCSSCVMLSLICSLKTGFYGICLPEIISHAILIFHHSWKPHSQCF